MTEGHSRTTTKTTLFAFGSNGQGQLGVGDNEDHHTPQTCTFVLASNRLAQHVPLIDGEQIHKLASGGNHTLLLTTHGRVFSTGSSNIAQHDEGLTYSTSATIQSSSSSFSATCWSEVYGAEIKDDSGPTRITDVACTWTASFFVIDGRVIDVVGYGDRGELGLGEKVTQSSQRQTCFDVRALQFENTFMPETDQIAHIVGLSASMAHVIVLLSSGRLFGWGASRKGQLGEQVRGQASIWTPIEITWSEPRLVPSFVVTGRDWTFVSSATGSKHHFLGDDKKFNPVAQWTKEDWEEETEPIQTIHAGWSSVTVLMRTGHARGYGKDDRGQLPPSTLLHQSSKILAIAVGSEHTVAILEDGQVVAWGWGEHGNCGSTVDESKNVNDGYNTVFKIDAASPRKVVGVAAGCATSFFWVSS